MAQEALRAFIDRATHDSAFRDQLREDPSGGFAEYELSPTERVAMLANDEDALRRLLREDVSGFFSRSLPQGLCLQLGPARGGWYTVTCPAFSYGASQCCKL